MTEPLSSRAPRSAAIHRACAVFSLFAALVFATEARAGSIEIAFDLAASTMSALGITVPPNGQVTAASVTIVVPGSGLSTPSTGIAEMRSFTLNGTVNAVILATVTGFLDADQIGGVTATFNTLSRLSIFNTWSVDLSGMLDCSGGLCGFLGSWPQTFNSPQTITVAYLRLDGLSTPGSATVNGTFALFLGSIFATVRMIGTEVNRTFVPEPGSPLLLGAGVASLAGLALLSERRRRARSR